MKFLFFIFFICWASDVDAQSLVHLHVEQPHNQEPIPHTEIYNNKGEWIISTDSQGNASILVSESTQYLIISDGYIDTSVTLYPDMNALTIILHPIDKTFNTLEIQSSKLAKSLTKSNTQEITLSRHRNESFQAGTNTVEDLISTLAPISTLSDPLLGSANNINGLGGNNIKVLIDGVAVNGRLNGNIDLSQFSLYNLQSVQVYFGPQSLIYGSDAAGGMINLISFAPSKKPDFNLSTYIEGIGRYNMDLQASSSFGKNGLSLSLGRYYFDGYNIGDSFLRKKEWLPKEQYFAGLKYIREFQIRHLKANIQLRDDYYKEFLYNPGEPSISQTQHTATAFDDTYVTNRNQATGTLNMYGNKWSHQWQNAYSTYLRQTKTYYQDFVSKSETEITPPDANNEDFAQFQSRWIASSKKLGKLEWETGLDFTFESGQGSKISQRQKRNELAPFLLTRYDLKRWQFIPGLRWTIFNFDQSRLLPALQLVYHDDHGWNVELGYNQAYRVPSLKEKYLYFVDINHHITGNPNLQAENTQSINFGISRDWLEKVSKWNLKLNSSYNDVKNKIILSPIAGTLQEYTYANVGVLQDFSQWLSLQYSYKNQHHEWNANISWSWTHFFRYDNQIDKDQVNQNISLSYYQNQWQLGVKAFAKTSFRQPVFVSDVSTTIYRELQTYTMSNLGIYKYVYHKKIKIELGIKNIFNVTSIPFRDGQGITSPVGGHGSTGTSLQSSTPRTIYGSLYWDI